MFKIHLIDIQSEQEVDNYISKHVPATGDLIRDVKNNKCFHVHHRVFRMDMYDEVVLAISNVKER